MIQVVTTVVLHAIPLLNEKKEKLDRKKDIECNSFCVFDGAFSVCLLLEFMFVPVCLC